MNRIIKISYILLSLLALLSCNKNKDKTHNIAINKNLQIIDVDNIRKEDKILLSSIFNKVKTIPLETEDSILLGEINGIQTYNNLIFILDKYQNIGIHVFNKEGKYVKKIGKRGSGPEEFISISDFTIDERNDEIYLMDSDANKIHKYNISTAEFISSIKLEDPNILSNHLQYNNGKLYTDITYTKEPEDAYMLRQINPLTGKQENCWLDIRKYNKNWNGILQREGDSFFYSRNLSACKFIHFFMDTIISIDKNGIMPSFVLKDKDWITPENILQIKKDRDKNGGLITFNVVLSQNKAFNINNYMEWKHFVYFNYQKGNNSFFVLHNTKTNTTQFTDILIDDLVYGKPVLTGKFGCIDSNGVYGYISMGEMSRFVERVKNENILNPELDKIEELKNLPEYSNPVLFYYEF